MIDLPGIPAGELNALVAKWHSEEVFEALQGGAHGLDMVLYAISPPWDFARDPTACRNAFFEIGAMTTDRDLHRLSDVHAHQLIELLRMCLNERTEHGDLRDDEDTLATRAIAALERLRRRGPT